ncbi:DUF4359 domain-containing protein [Bacillus luteolus]|uniref:DUF4359 domain-containing protein n=1 Tax=Litchfieldia luteola TaxID=682179 RepID=A0ABR9QGR6_9BACI|nr:DUF4359 domain-containing protein [Cytobacillus luteolus]MBE4907689.1 DUF4359 domain-containing protein [Cytobacillus luteolus]MBP1941140.1 hypothetical protein [Cytobacillus luteolus]
MKKSYIMIGVILALVIILVITNPKQEEYVNWATQQITEDKGILLRLGADHLAKPVIHSATETTNFVLFSVYKTAMPHKEENITTIGFLNQFITTK